ncbi:hypothetical protein Dimus_027154 [Dionaea muscipula]
MGTISARVEGPCVVLGLSAISRAQLIDNFGSLLVIEVEDGGFLKHASDLDVHNEEPNDFGLDLAMHNKVPIDSAHLNPNDLQQPSSLVGDDSSLPDDPSIPPLHLSSLPVIEIGQPSGSELPLEEEPPRPAEPASHQAPTVPRIHVHDGAHDDSTTREDSETHHPSLRENLPQDELMVQNQTMSCNQTAHTLPVGEHSLTQQALENNCSDSDNQHSPAAATSPSSGGMPLAEPNLLVDQQEINNEENEGFHVVHKKGKKQSARGMQFTEHHQDHPGKSKRLPH